MFHAPKSKMALVLFLFLGLFHFTSRAQAKYDVQCAVGKESGFSITFESEANSNLFKIKRAVDGQSSIIARDLSCSFGSLWGGGIFLGGQCNGADTFAILPIDRRLALIKMAPIERPYPTLYKELAKLPHEVIAHDLWCRFKLSKR